MDISDKKTVLEDSASIYQKREEKSDRAKWKELKGGRAKWEHFKAYYLLKTFILVCVCAFCVYVVYEMVRPKPERVIYVAILDTAVLNTETEALQKGFEEYFGMDSETQETLFDNSMRISDASDTAGRQKFTTHSFAGEIDVLIAPESVVRGYAGVYLKPLSEQLPTDLYEQVSERFCYASVTEDDGTVVEGSEEPYGIYVTELIETSPYCEEPVVIAICGNSQHEKNAEEFIRYLLQRTSGTTEEK